MSKPRAKLSPSQKNWLENLEWYAKNIVDWQGDNKNFKDVVEIGKYAVFSKRPDFWDDENKKIVPGVLVILGASDEYTVDCMVKRNCCEWYHVVDLEYLMKIQVVTKLMKPSFANWVAKLGEAEFVPA